MIRYAVVGDTRRIERAEALAAQLGAFLFVDGIPKHLGACWNHRRALAEAAHNPGHIVVLEDDALPVDGFKEKAAAWISRHPDDLISFYLGTGHPKEWQKKASDQITLADLAGRDYIELPKLIHAVCYALPTDRLAKMHPLIRQYGNIDYNIGGAWRRVTKRDVVYPLASLVDHDDELPSLLSRQREPRRARLLA